MLLKQSLKTALKSLKAHKSRSGLTILGIVIGITSIMLVMSTGKGAEDLILGQIRGLGSNTVFVEPGREPTGPASFAEIFTDSLKERDLEALKNPNNVRGVKEIAPNVVQPAVISFAQESIRANVIGTSGLMVKILELYPKEGIFFSEDYIKQRAKVAVLGSEIKKKLFGGSSALGEKIKIKNLAFRVIGILPAKGQISFFNADEMVIVPYTTAQEYLFGIDHFNSFIVQAESDQMVPSLVKEIELTLRENHNIDDPKKDDFHVTSQAEVAERVSTVTDIMTVLLVAVAAISIIVGGIGIMNIMLVSVTERTREIGLRKALGATERDILIQFLLEAIVLTSVGGIIGIILGAFFSFVGSLVLSKVVGLGWAFVFPLSAALLGLAVAGFIGLVFGIYPAKRAASLNPIDALRYE